MNTKRLLINVVLILSIMIFPFVSEGSSVIAAPLAASTCLSSSPTSGAYTVSVCITSPDANANLTGDATVTATASVTGTNPGIQRMVFYLTGGAYLLTDYQSPYTFTLATSKWVDGIYALSVSALMRDGFTTQQTLIPVYFTNGISSPPINTNTFTPTSGLPANGSPFVVVAAGDGASGETNAKNVSNLISTLNPNLVLYLGDVYEKGSPMEFLNWYGSQGSNFGTFRSITNPTIGNHEYGSGSNAAGYFNYWDNIPNYYSYNAGGWHFISLNSNYRYIGIDPQSTQYQWLQQDLAANAQACTIVYYHHPLFNIGPEGSTSQLSDIWALMAQYKVTIVLNGHDHTYQRWIPLDGAGLPSSTGITEFIAGASGHGLQTITGSDSRVAFSIDQNPTAFGALALTLNTSGANYKYVNTSGSILDSGAIACNHATSDTQSPTTPTNVNAAAANQAQINLSWSSSSDNVGVTGYRIFRNNTELATVDGSILTYLDSNLIPSTTYTYTVDAFDQAGNFSAKSSPVSATTLAMPANLIFTPSADTYVSSANPSTNYGSATTLRLDASPDLHGYLRFVVQGTSGYPISRASLNLYANTTSSFGFQTSAVADTTWGENTVVYSNAPTLGSILASSGPSVANSWSTLDISSYITGDGTYNLGILTSSSSAMSFPSREAGTNIPQLILEMGSQNNPDTQAPSIPSGITASALSQQVNLAWNASTDNVGVTGYTIYRDGVSLTTVSGSTLSFSDTSVSPSTSYNYALDAFDLAGNHSAQSSPINVTTTAPPDSQAPTVPSGLIASTPSSSQVDLSWFASTDNVAVAGYTIYRDGASITTVNGSTLTYSDNTVAPSTSYTYAVDAFDQAGNHSALSSPVPATTPAFQDTLPPSIPSNLQAVSSSPNQVSLNWSASTDNVGVTGYTIYRNGASLTTVSGTTLSYADTTVAPATSYSYSLDAFDLAGNHSAVTNPVSVTTQSLASVLTFIPAADTYVSASSPTSNYGTAKTLRLDASPDIHAYMRFTVTGVSGRTIQKATMRLYTTTKSTQGIKILSVTDNSWVEKSMTYNTAPPLGSILASSGGFAAKSWISIDVTGYITGDGTYNVGIITPSSTAISLSSRESSATAPQLILGF